MTEKRKDIRKEVADKWPRFGRREVNRIASLIDHKEHLEMKLTERANPRLYYWKSEASALEWVLNTIIPDFHSVLPEKAPNPATSLPEQESVHVKVNGDEGDRTPGLGIANAPFTVR